MQGSNGLAFLTAGSIKASSSSRRRGRASEWENLEILLTSPDLQLFPTALRMVDALAPERPPQYVHAAPRSYGEADSSQVRSWRSRPFRRMERRASLHEVASKGTGWSSSRERRSGELHARRHPGAHVRGRCIWCASFDLVLPAPADLSWETQRWQRGSRRRRTISLRRKSTATRLGSTPGLSTKSARNSRWRSGGCCGATELLPTWSLVRQAVLFDWDCELTIGLSCRQPRSHPSRRLPRPLCPSLFLPRPSLGRIQQNDPQGSPTLRSRALRA